MTQNRKVTEEESSRKQGSSPQKSHLVTWFIIFVAGFLAGVAFTVYKGKIIGPEQSTPGVVQPQAQSNGSSQAISDLEAEVAAHPDNFENWVQLGHLYYDADQPKKAIAAYTKSLELHAGDANLLTDLGVMYRRVEQPEKAIELFDQAIKQDPNHLPSRFNKGIVLMYDLNDPNGAIAAWDGLLAINPEAKTASGEPIREFVEKIKAGLPKNK
ncbi:tetratricopeptide repeat protein [Desulfopila sp. IMCC35006]|uniref:tetratricopeptide repeat protein n=1 Tax=Desulfopila sp. IMCC35006 TaxID=2569542 RepID=UPI0010AC665E|nr:tetratricopeptide repeat protein [Desulfopila sp. IMCC35006]TKB28286.1 tetratricopeptide repeat protein [Desulfopila sp. IMCC35006]